MADEEQSEGRKVIGLIPLGVAVTLSANLVAGVWFLAGQDGRVHTIEEKQVALEHRVDDKQAENAKNFGRLDEAREATNLHMSQLDGEYKSLDDKISAILKIVERWDEDPTEPPPVAAAGEHAPAQPGFPRPPGRR